MKKIIITLVVSLLITVSSLAQQGINYKALLKDSNDNVLANTFMNVQFSIHENSTTGTIVYQENHNYTTDANGLIILNIGTDPSPNVGTFTSIDWGADLHFLQTTITYNDGTINFDATEFMAVPYAKHAITAENVSGLEKITEFHDSQYYTGWRLIGKNPDNYGPIGNGAVDLSQSPNNANYGAIGEYSIAMGNQTRASGNNSTVMGNQTRAYGDNSTAMGFGTSASGNNATALGRNTFASSENSLAIGWLNEDVPDALFMIGNGSTEVGFTTSNALTVLNNGTITAPSFDISEITDDKALITKEYADTNLGGSGLEAIDEGNGIGWRLKGYDPNNFSNIGLNAVDLSFSNVLGSSSGATGENSVAMGEYAKASGKNSIAIGRNTKASGEYSLAMGSNTTAPSYAETVMGTFSENYTPNSTTSINPTDRLFTVANGKLRSNFSVQPSSALIILKNGTITAPSLTNSLINTAGNKALITKEYSDTQYLRRGGNNDNFNVGIGNLEPESLFEVAHQDGAPSTSNLTNALSIRNLGNDNSVNTSDDESWQLYTEDNGYLLLFRNGSFRGAFNATSGAYGQTSDRRLKKDITALDNGTLNKVMQLNPVSYLMKDQKDTKRNLGLISQEVQELFPSITHYVEAQDILSLSYTELIPILIKALQEQQAIIDGQNAQIDTMSADNSSLKTSLSNLISRVEKIEANNQ